MNNQLLNYFPAGYKPNEQQVKLIKGIEEAFSKGHKFVICSAPTGTGKSFISKTLSDASEEPTSKFVESINSYAAYKDEDSTETKTFGGFVLTITKSLQDQYSELFTDIKILKGKNNYACEIDDQYAVDLAPCVHIKKMREECWAKNTCKYYNARNEALTHKFTSLNYNMFFALPDNVKHREVLVCDEASELEDVFVKEFSCSVNLDLLKACGIKPSFAYVEDYSKMQRWLSEIAAEVLETSRELEQVVGKKQALNSFMEAERSKMIQLKNLGNRLSLLIESWGESEYIIERVKNEITFTPLKIDNLTNRLFAFADKVILMSATIIDHTHFAKTLGISDYVYIEADSSFEAKKSPIHIATKLRLNSRNLQEKLPQLCKVIEKICNHHKDDKGIIHTHTNEITKFLQINVKGDRYLFREPGVVNEDILQQHTDSTEPTILVSPSMSHGIDLKGDLAKFQIIIKAPFLPLMNKRIKRLFDIDKCWYENKMISTFIQACGRGTRSTKDTCVTYVLDGNIADAVVRNKAKLPKYFLSRFA